MIRKKRILLVANTSWYLINFRKGVINFFLEEGYEVFCLAPKDSYSVLLEEVGANFIEICIDAKGINPLNDIRYFLSLRRIYKKYKPDFIFHYTIKPNIFGAIAANSLNIPSIAIVSGAGIVFLKRNWLFNIVKPMYKYAAGKALETWFVNSEDKDFFLRERIVSNDCIQILPGEGVNIDVFKREGDYKELSHEKFIFLFSARLLWEKGIQYYVNCAKRLHHKYPYTEFWVIGFYDTDNQNAVKPAHIKLWEKEGSIKYLGALKNVKPLLEKIHCLVFPSYYREGVPRVLLEAASMEIPIVTSNNVGCRDVVINGENGYLCEVKNEDSLFDKMEAILNTPHNILESMGKIGREIVIDKFEERFVIEYYKRAMEKYI